MILYLDSSALVKRYVREAGSDDVEGLTTQAETAPMIYPSSLLQTQGIQRKNNGIMRWGGRMQPAGCSSRLSLEMI
jgi:hypothetical protein